MPHRALVVIDVQQEYATGRLPISHPPLEDSLANIGRAMDAAQQAGLPVAVVQQTTPPGSAAFARGTAEWELHPVVARRPADLLVEKRFPGAFTGTELEQWLRDRGIDTVTCVGYMTQHCVSTTARQAMHAGFAAEVLSDATGTLGYANSAGRVSAEEMHRVHLVALHANLAAVATTQDWLAAVAEDRPLPIDSPVASAAAALAVPA